MNLDALADPLFRLPFLTGLLLAGVLPVLGMYLRLRHEWLAALAYAQMASAGALLAALWEAPLMAGGISLALLAAGAKSGLRHAGDSGYAMMMLAGWGGAILLVANLPAAEQIGHALFDGQLYFTSVEQSLAVAAYGAGVAVLLPWLSRPLLLAHYFPDFLSARGGAPERYYLGFDLLVAAGLALATTTVGVMAAFALVFLPPLAAYRWAGSWRRGLGWAAALGMLCHALAFLVALIADQPYGPVLALMAVVVAAPAVARRR